MYLIIDIRAPRNEDALMVRYATNWGDFWREENPHDTIVYLLYEDQIAPAGASIFYAKKNTLLAPKRKLTLTKENEVFRSVNFSRYAAYDPSVATTTHIFDMGRWLYDNITNANIFKRKEREFTIRKILSTSMHIIVPDFPTGSELVEMWNIGEDKLDVLPFLSMNPIDPDDSVFDRFQIGDLYFLYDGTYGNESNITALLHGFAHYRNEKKGQAMLVLHGNTHNALSSLVDLISELELTSCVKLTGMLDIHEQESLYNHAQGWISIASYPTNKLALALALSKNLNLLLSKIPQYNAYEHAIKTHPGHIHELAQSLEMLEHSEKQDVGYPGQINNATLISLYKQLLMDGKEKPIE